MKQKIEKNKGFLLILILFIIIQCIVILWFGHKKQGYFIDEIYSFGLSNGYYKPFITSYGDQIFDKWADSQVVQQYMTVQRGERFAYGSVIYNQGQDVHPPMFYLLLHTVSSFFPGEYSKWFGIGINLVCLILCSIILWKLGSDLMRNKWFGLVPVIIWGLSAGTVSYTIYIRMYMLLTLFTLLSTWFHKELIENGQSMKLLAGVFIVTVCGILTQYYFVILAFYLSAGYCIWKFLKKSWKDALVYAGVMFGAVGTSILLFPASITQLTRTDEVVIEETRKNLGNLDTFITNIKSYCYGINSDFLSGIYKVVFIILLLAMIGVLAAIFNKRKRGSSVEKEEATGWLILIGSICTILTIAAVAVVPSPRYICSIYPLLVLSGVWLLWRYIKGAKVMMSFVMAMMSALFLFLSFISYNQGFVQYLYEEEPERLEKAEQYSSLPCIYVTNYRMAALTQDLRTISCYKEFYVTSQDNLIEIEKIINGKDLSNGLIVTVDNNAYWGSGYDAEAIVADISKVIDVSSVQCLFTQELSATYLLK